MQLTRFSISVVLISGVALAQEEIAPRHEVGLTLGHIATSTRGGTLDLGSGTALQANYGFKLLEGRHAALYGEVHFLASPLREVTSLNTTATRDFASIYLTPGIRVKFLPLSRFAPYVAIGGGWATYEQSLTRLDGQPNSAPRSINRGTIDFGGGVDVKFWRFVSLRGEIRDFYSGSPAYNTALIRGGQHNLVIGGGFVLRFR